MAKNIKTKPKDSDEYYDRRTKNMDECFCYSCGAVVKKNSNICPKCGVILNVMGVKDKSIAIFLAIFTSFFSWLYLYEKNTIKFWLGIIITICGYIFFKNTLYPISYMGILVIVLIWLFAIIDVTIKDKEYYNSFRR